MDQSTNKKPMRAILQVVYGKNRAILGAVLFAWQQTTAWVIRKTGTLLADVDSLEVQCLKSLSNLVFTHLSNAGESIYVTYFQQKDIDTKSKLCFQGGRISLNINYTWGKFALSVYPSLLIHR